jgi:hypothetical protein
VEELTIDEKTLLKDIFVASGLMDDMDDWAHDSKVLLQELHDQVWDLIDKLGLDELKQAYARSA